MRRGVLRIVALALPVLCLAEALASAQGPKLQFRSPVKVVDPIKVEVPAESHPLSKTEVKFSPNTNMPQASEPQAGPLYPMTELALLSNDYMDERYFINSQHPDDLGLWERTRDEYHDQFHRLWRDTKNFYWSDNLLKIGAVIAVAAPVANTDADQRMRDWYQRRVRPGQSSSADGFADAGRQVGDYKYVVPALFALSAGGHLFPDHEFMTPIGEFGDRSLRALAIGAPTVGILRVGLGGERPEEGSSRWRPSLDGHGVSGHAFVGAVPFLTAASMTESRPLKALLVAGSLWPAWSRIHEDRQYFSQVFIGWSIACLATQAVNQTENDHVRIVPMTFPNGMGMGVHIQY